MKDKKSVIALLLVCSVGVSAQQVETGHPVSRQHHLMPAPVSIQFLAGGRLAIDGSFTVGTNAKDREVCRLQLEKTNRTRLTYRINKLP
jgi:hypothetical protein